MQRGFMSPMCLLSSWHIRAKLPLIGIMVSPEVSSSESAGEKIKENNAEFERIQSTFTNKSQEMKKSSFKVEG